MPTLWFIWSGKNKKTDFEKFESKSKNIPFTGFKITGKACLTMVEGRIVYESIK